MQKQDVHPNPTLGLFAGVFLLSAAVLSLEILASRISSVILVHNYAFMVVSLAILGLGCGGIFVFYKYRAEAVSSPYEKFSFYSSLFAASAALFILLITKTPFLTNRFVYFLALFIPFFFAGIVLSLAFRSFPQKSFKLYAVDLLGAAFGSLQALWILQVLGGVNGILFIAVLGSVACFCFMARHRDGSGYFKIPALLSSLCLLLFLVSMSAPFLGRIPIARHPTKDLYNMLSDPLVETEIVETKWSAFGRSDLARYKKDDSQMVLFVDGAAGTVMYKFNGDLKNPGKNIESFRATFPGSFPFHFLKENEKDNMLVIGPGGGKEILLGLLAGVKNITGVEVNRDFVEIVKEYRDYNGGIYTDFKNVNIIADEGRSFLRSSDQKYDIIMFTLPVTKSSRSFEGYALTENYLFTVESIKEYLAHLTEEGRIIVVLHHPYEMLRFTVTAIEALGQMKINSQDAMKHIYTLGREMSPLLVLKKSPFTFKEADIRHKGMHFLSLDYPLSSYIPHIKQQELVHEHKEGKFHKASMFNEAMVALSTGNVKVNDLVEAMPYNISATTDDKPFFFKTKLGLPDEISSLLGLILLVNALVIGIPVIHKRVGRNMIMPLAIFMLLGAGFMMIEISFFQKLTLYLGLPTIALVVLLSSLLIGMGLGSFFGGRLFPNDNINRLKIISLTIFVLVITLLFIQPLILNMFLGSGIGIKAVICSLFLLPLGFALGIPFPTAISLLKEMNAERAIAWMYGVNGTMSVLGSVIAISVSLMFGFSITLALGALCYLAIAIILT